MRDQFVGDGIRIENALVFWAHRVNAAANQAMAAAFKQAKVKLTPEQWMVLVQLWERDGQTQSALGEATFRDKPTMSRLIVGMETRKLVVRKGSPSDARAKYVFLTPQGRALKGKLVPIARKIVEKMQGGVDEKQLVMTRETLKRLFQNLA